MKSSQFQSFLFLMLIAFFVAHFVLLSPSSLEEDFNGVRVVHPKDLLNFLKHDPTSASKEVPVGVTPSYSMRDLTFYSTTDNKPNWKLKAKRSNVYQQDQLIHGTDVTLELTDHTVVNSHEGVFHTQTEAAELYTDVHTVFHDGTTLDSQFARVLNKPVTDIEIPVTEPVHGEKLSARTKVEFDAHGLSYLDVSPQEVKLLADTHVVIHSFENGRLKKTWIDADHATYAHLTNHLIFNMSEDQPLEKQFVTAKQLDLDMKSRTLEVNAGPDGKPSTLVANGEVWMKDSRDLAHVSTGTAGKAVYYDKRNEIQLYDYPQLYQDGDTITGDVIVFNRARDTVEVRESNAIYKH